MLAQVSGPLDAALRVALVLLAALSAMPLLRGRSAVARRLVLSVAFGAALLVPLLPSRVATVHVDAPAVHGLVARVVQEPAVSTDAASRARHASVDTPKFDIARWLVLGWAAVAAAIAMRALIGYLVVGRLARRAPASATWQSAIAAAAAKTGIVADVRLSSGIHTPAVAGPFEPVILVPESSVEWTLERKLAVLLHELAHVAAHDLRVQLLATGVCALHWFNPLAWIAARRLRLERELAADEAALRSGIRASTYAEDLLAIAGAPPHGAIAIGTRPLTHRITAIVAAEQPARVGRPGLLALAAGTSAVALGVACTNVSAPVVTSAAGPAAEPAATAVASTKLQQLAASELQAALAKWRATTGTILIMTPGGDALAEAGEPDRAIIIGSTMKPFLLATALDEGIEPEANIASLLATSDNPGFMRLFERVGSAKLGQRLGALHFSTPRTLDASAAIGGTFSGTPRQVAKAYAALASGGIGVFTPPSVARVTKMLEGVVASDEGTGKKARVAGARGAGKTGTSDWTDANGKHGYASFVGYVPAEAPRYVIYVGIESPQGEKPWGGEVAAPVFARIAEESLR